MSDNLVKKMNDDLADQLMVVWRNVMNSTRRMTGGVGSMTAEAAMRATICEITEWDTTLIIEASLFIKELEAEKTKLENDLAHVLYRESQTCIRHDERESKLEAENARLREALKLAIERIDDMLKDDDSQAWKEAEKALPLLLERLTKTHLT